NYLSQYEPLQIDFHGSGFSCASEPFARRLSAERGSGGALWERRLINLARARCCRPAGTVSMQNSAGRSTRQTPCGRCSFAHARGARALEALIARRYVALLSDNDRLPCGLAQFELCPHVLNLRCLLFHRRSERFDFFL